MSDLEEAKEAVNELRNALSAAFEALESLEGYIDDADSIQGITLDWDRGEPQISDMLQRLALSSATFEESI